MVKAIYQAARSLEFKTKNVEIVANNLANLSTVGYKRELPFSELMVRNSVDAFPASRITQAPAPVPSQIAHEHFRPLLGQKSRHMRPIGDIAHGVLFFLDFRPHFGADFGRYLAVDA